MSSNPNGSNKVGGFVSESNGRFCTAAICFIFVTFVAMGAEVSVPSVQLQSPTNTSLRNEVRHAIDKGLAWLQPHQNTNGYWSTPDHPAMTALVLEAFELRPDRDPKSEPEAVKKGYDFLMSCVQPDGGIYQKELQSYNTSVSLMAILLRDLPENRAVTAKARKFLVGLQVESGDAENPFNGGIGYGATEKQPDLSNTVLALEALSYSKPPADQKGLAEPDLNWKSAIQFVQRCQNLPGSNHEKWASDDPQNKGGFVYAPGSINCG